MTEECVNYILKRDGAQRVSRPEKPNVTVETQSMLTAADNRKTMRGSPWSISMP